MRTQKTPPNLHHETWLIRVANLLKTLEEGLNYVKGLNRWIVQGAPVPRWTRQFRGPIRDLVPALRCLSHLSNLIKDPPEFWLRNKAHGSIRIQKGQQTPGPSM
jgi:hypothetical protein